MHSDALHCLPACLQVQETMTKRLAEDEVNRMYDEMYAQERAKMEQR